MHVHYQEIGKNREGSETHLRIIYSVHSLYFAIFLSSVFLVFLLSVCVRNIISNIQHMTFSACFLPFTVCPGHSSLLPVNTLQDTSNTFCSRRGPGCLQPVALTECTFISALLKLRICWSLELKLDH